MAYWQIEAIGQDAVRIEYDLASDLSEIENFKWQTEKGPTFNKSNGTITINGLEPGEYNTIPTATVNRFYTKIYYTDEGRETEDVEDTITLFSLSCYTHPGEFHFDARSGQTEPNHSHSIIANVLTTDNVNKWISYVDKAYCWKNQSSNGYSNISNLQIPDNKVITHTWYNNCAAALRGLGKTINDVAQNSVITANAINLLDFNGVKI